MSRLKLSVGNTALQNKLVELGKDYDSECNKWASQGKELILNLSGL
jgi:hypothetical protein